MINQCSSYFKIFVVHKKILNLLKGLQNLLHFNNDIMFKHMETNVAREINVTGNW
jgi:hypothetical protein